MCSCSRESQLCPGLHHKKHGQQVKRDVPAPLLCAGEASPGLLHPEVEFSVQKRYRSVGVQPEKGHRNDPRGVTPLLRGQAERAEALQLREEKAPR